MQDRHRLVWLTPDGWRAARERAPASQRSDLQEWAKCDWPAVVRRVDADVDVAADEVCLGVVLPVLPTPPDGKRPHIASRIPLRAPAAAVATSRDPLMLREALPAAPAAWRPALLELDARASECGLTLRVYGSLAWQALTGKSYLTPTSDIDLLVRPDTPPRLGDALALLSLMSEALPLDGEILFPGGDAVAWKEWHAAAGNSARVLVKGTRTVRLSTTAALMATLEQPCLP